jgi:ketosteroid isomerase-like protein
MSHHTRSVQEVFAHHVKGLNEAKTDDVAFDYAENAIFITKDDGVVRGREAIKKWFHAALTGPLLGAKFEAAVLTVEGEIIYLEWKAEANVNRASGVDTFVVRDGEIRAQTVKILSLGPR